MACLDCGCPTYSTLACKVYGACKMHDTANLNRARDEAHQRGEMHVTEKNQEQMNAGNWLMRRRIGNVPTGRPTRGS